MPIQMPIHLPEYCLYGLYFLVGPGAWILFAIGMYQAQKRMDLVDKDHDRTPDPQPPVTILIPAKDERERIGDCVRSALAQDYRNFKVVVIDDRSTDGTGELLDALATGDGRLEVAHVPEGDLPPGWTGKNHALHYGMSRADGEWLLFIDADVMLDPEALSATLAVAQRKNYGLVSLLPRMDSHSIWEGLVVPLAGAAVASLYMAALTNASQLPNTAFANGQFMLIRRDAYFAAGGHTAVCDKYCEDMVMANIHKRMGLRPRVSWGIDLCSVRMYDSFQKIMRGWSRIFYASGVGSPWRSIFGIIFIFLCCYSAAGAMAWGIYRNMHPIDFFGGGGWILTAVIHYALMTTQIGIMYRWTLNPRRYALLFPLASVFLLIIFVRAIWMCVTKKVEWRGTRYTHVMKSDPTTSV